MTVGVRAGTSSDGYVQIDGADVLKIAAGGVITTQGQLNSAGHVIPTLNNNVDLGTSANRWRNIYTNDLQLSNGIGDYTIVEGHDDLFLYNNKTGKTFKFALIEVDPKDVPAKAKEGDGI